MATLQDGGAGQQERGRKGGTKGPSSCFKVVKMIMERQLQPVIVFSFSRRDCEAYALQMSKLDFNSSRERGVTIVPFNRLLTREGSMLSAMVQLEWFLY